jgi:hypothetical protein
MFCCQLPCHAGSATPTQQQHCAAAALYPQQQERPHSAPKRCNVATAIPNYVQLCKQVCEQPAWQGSPAACCCALCCAVLQFCSHQDAALLPETQAGVQHAHPNHRLAGTPRQQLQGKPSCSCRGYSNRRRTAAAGAANPQAWQDGGRRREAAPAAQQGATDETAGAAKLQVAQHSWKGQQLQEK